MIVMAVLAAALQLPTIPERPAVPPPPAPTVPTVGTGFQLTAEAAAELIEVYFPPQWRGWAERVMCCESHRWTNARNPSSGTSGLFQFKPGTWDWVAANTGTPGFDAGGVWEVHSQLINAAWLVTNAGPQHWECK